MQSEEHLLLKYLQAAQRVVEVIARRSTEKSKTKSTHEKNLFVSFVCVYP